MIRLAIGNARTQEADVVRAWEVLQRMRAVIFDLWDTLVDWPVGEGEELKQRVAEHVGGDPDAFEQAWRDELPRLADGAVADVLALARRPGRARRRARRARGTSSAAASCACARARATRSASCGGAASGSA